MLDRIAQRRRQRQEQHRRLQSENLDEKVMLNVIRAEARVKEERALSAAREERNEVLHTTIDDASTLATMVDRYSAITSGGDDLDDAETLARSSYVQGLYTPLQVCARLYVRRLFVRRPSRLGDALCHWCSVHAVRVVSSHG